MPEPLGHFLIFLLEEVLLGGLLQILNQGQVLGVHHFIDPILVYFLIDGKQRAHEVPLIDEGNELPPLLFGQLDPLKQFGQHGYILLLYGVLIRKKVSSAEDAPALDAFLVGLVLAGCLVLGGEVVDIRPLQEMVEDLYLVDVELKAALFCGFLFVDKGISDGLIFY